MILSMTVALTSRPRPHWLVDDVIPLGALTVLAAAPGAGATTLATGLIVATISQDFMYLGHATRTGSAAYLTSQGQYEKTRTIDSIYQGHINADPMDRRELAYFSTKDTDPWKTADIEEYLENCIVSPNSSKHDFKLLIIDDVSDVSDDKIISLYSHLNTKAAKSNVAIVIVDRLPDKIRQRRRYQARFDLLQQAPVVLTLERVQTGALDGPMRLQLGVHRSVRARDGYSIGIDVQHDTNADDQPMIRMSVVPPTVQLSAPITKLGKLDKAVETVQAAMQAHVGQPVPHAQLLAVASAQGVGERTAREAVREAVQGFGTAVTVQTLPERGSPRIYTLHQEAGEASTNPTPGTGFVSQDDETRLL